MKKIPKTIQIDAYTDDDGRPVCYKCVFGPMDNCMLNKWCAISTRWEPGPECPVWRKQADTGAEAANLCTWWRCAGLDKDPDAEDDQP
jgi:hypothetical protein